MGGSEAVGKGVIVVERAALERGDFPAGFALEVVVMIEIGALVQRGVFRDRHGANMCFLNQIADGPVDSGDAQSGADLSRCGMHILGGEGTNAVGENGLNGGALLCVTFCV